MCFVVARLVLFAGAIVGLAIWIAGLIGYLAPQEQEQIRQAQAKIVLERLVSLVDAQTEQLERLATSAANRPGLGEALIRGLPDIQRLALEADFSLLLPGGIATRIYKLGEAELEPDAAMPITFATLDLIERVESGDVPPAESFVQGDQRLLRLARPIKKDDQIVGTLVIVTDQDLTLTPLSSATGLGRVSLIQRFDGANAQTIFATGQGEGDLLSADTRHPYWKLQIQPSSALAAQLGINTTAAILFAALAVMLALSGGMVALVLTRRQTLNDLAALTQHVLASHREPGLQPPDFADPAMAKAALALGVKSAVRPDPVAAMTFDEPDEPAPLAHEPKPEKSQLTDSPEDSLEELLPVEPTEQPQSASDPSITPNEPDAPDLAPLEFPGFSETTPPKTAQPEETTPAEIETIALQADVSLTDQGSFSMSSDFTPDARMFRAYDIRGVVTAGFNTDLAYAVGKALASEAAAQGQSKVITGGDGRLSTPELKQALNQGVQSAGLDVIDIGIVPTPLVYYACSVSETQTGIMVTGSHNPKDYNGFKMMIAGVTLAGDEIQDLLRRIETRDWIDGNGGLETRDYVPAYIDEVAERIQLTRKPSIVIDCGNGVAGMMAQQFFERLGCQVDALYTEVDGNFPNHHPDPSKPANVAELQARVKSLKADIGFAFDGDGDRVGVITAAGENVFADRLMMLLGMDVASRNPGEPILYDVKCSRHLGELIRDAGGQPVMWKTGHSLVKRKMKEVNAPLGGEMSGHVFFKENWHGFDDALYTAARVLELTDRKQHSMDEMLASLPSDVSTPEINLTVTDEGKFKIVEKLANLGWFEGGDLSTVDGVRVDYPDGFGLVRASNTTPVLVLRFEAENETALDRIRDQFKTQLTLVEPDLSLDF